MFGLSLTKGICLPSFLFLHCVSLLLLGCQSTRLQQKYIHFSFHIDTTTQFLFYFKLLLCVLYLCPSLPLRTSEDECGNRDREVLGQSLGAAGRMHRAVVGGAASVGKRRPGPISTQREEDKEGRFGHKQRDTSQSECSQRGKKRDAHKNQTPQHCNRVKKETKRKRRFYSPSSPWQETHAQLSANELSLAQSQTAKMQRQQKQMTKVKLNPQINRR